MSRLLGPAGIYAGAVILLVLFCLSAPVGFVIMFPPLMCAGGMCPADQQWMGWLLVALVPTLYTLGFFGLFKVMKWAKAMMSEAAR